MELTYNPEIFDVKDHQSAKEIILTCEDTTTDVRWETETPYLLEILADIKLDENTNVLDFGTGIGRMPRALIEHYNCFCVGTDISNNMRALSIPYVNSDRFVVMSNQALSRFDMQFDLSMAIWVLQHCFNLDEAIKLLIDKTKPGGTVFVVNNYQRVVPCSIDEEAFCWADDGQNVLERLKVNPRLETILIDNFKLEKLKSPGLVKATWYGLFQKKQ